MSNRHHSYTEADIRRYLEGGMSRAEMHRLEVAALDDPFLQDALDGYTSAIGTEDPARIQEIVNELRKFKPSSGTRKYRSVIIPLWQRNIMQYAVAAMLVGVGGWYIFTIPEKEGITTARQEVPANSAKDSVAAIAPPPPGSLYKKQPAIIPPAKEEPGLAKRGPQPLNVNPLENNDQLATTENEGNVAESSQPAAAPSLKPLTTLQDVQANLATTPPKTLQGKVTDTADFPLDNITIQVKGSGTATVTDEMGRFNVKIPDSNATIIASAPGFKTKEIAAVSSSKKLDMKLERSSLSLGEVVVSGYSSKNKGFEPETDTSEASPSGGWRNFSRYLAENKKLKRSGKKAEIVILTFEVDKNGRPSEFEILQSAGKRLDDEAIRLLQEGPAWINKTQNPSPLAKVTVVF